MVKYKSTTTGIEAIEIISETARYVTYYNFARQEIVKSPKKAKYHIWHDTFQEAKNHLIGWIGLELRTAEFQVRCKQEALDWALALEEPSVKREEDYA